MTPTSRHTHSHPSAALQVRQYRTYVAREILHHASLRHPFIIGVKEVMLTERVGERGCSWVVLPDVLPFWGGGARSCRGRLSRKPHSYCSRTRSLRLACSTWV